MIKKPEILSEKDIKKLTSHWNPIPSRLDGITPEVIKLKLFQAVAQKALDDCYKEMLRQFIYWFHNIDISGDKWTIVERFKKYEQALQSQVEEKR